MSAGDAHPRNRPIQLVTLVAGAGLVAYGVYELRRGQVDPGQFARWFVAGILAHDLILAPTVFIAGWLVRRLAPRRLLAPVQAALIAAGILVLFAVPALSGRGKSAANPSQLPNDYPRDLALVIAAVWLAIAVAWVVAGRRRA